VVNASKRLIILGWSVISLSVALDLGLPASLRRRLRADSFRRKTQTRNKRARVASGIEKDCEERL
jgi:hypothetical protein